MGTVESVNENSLPRLFVGDGLRHHEIRMQASLFKENSVVYRRDSACNLQEKERKNQVNSTGSYSSLKSSSEDGGEKKISHMIF